VEIARQFGLADYGGASCAMQSMREELKISEKVGGNLKKHYQ